jgi:hypothetical protein
MRWTNMNLWPPTQDSKMANYFNDFPENWREISAEEFAYKLTNYPSTKQEYLQMFNPEQMTIELSTNAKLFHFADNSGLAIGYKTIHDEDFLTKRIAKFYAFGCKHNFMYLPWKREVLGFQMLNQRAHRCTKCGFTEVIDSSD